MGVYTKDEQYELIKEDWRNLVEIDNQYEDVCLEAVKQNGYSLYYVKEQTPEICLEAVKENGWALEYVKEQNPEICLEAVKQNGYSLQYVKEQTPEICLEAIKQDSSLIKMVKNKNPKLCFYAFIKNYDLLTYKYIKTGMGKYIKSNSVKNKVFCSKCFDFMKFKNVDFYFDDESLIELKDYLLKENSNNKFILKDSTDINLLKEIALSNNELVIIDTGKIKDIHKILANKIITEEDLKEESF